MDDWKDYKRVFLTLATPGTFWLLVFFIIPMLLPFVLSFSSKAVVNGETSVTDYDYPEHHRQLHRRTWHQLPDPAVARRLDQRDRDVPVSDHRLSAGSGRY